MLRPIIVSMGTGRAEGGDEVGVRFGAQFTALISWSAQCPQNRRLSEFEYDTALGAPAAAPSARPLAGSSLVGARVALRRTSVKQKAI